MQVIKSILVVALASSAAAFAPALPTLGSVRPRAAMTQISMEAASATKGKVNIKIELDSPKVATMTELKEGEKAVYCRCWESGTFPLCDGAHMAHNKETGDNLGPLIVTVSK
mmetsp:Transcript_6806/g.13690  ORF Transcript_6806/g.13690 Transcript_6806/m.13690 type:complete len:112 (-) Transcript_6806:85-420(-)